MGETCSLTFVCEGVVSETESHSSVGKQQAGDYLWKEEVFTFSDGTQPKVLKEFVDLIVGPLYIFSEKLWCWWEVLDSWKKINTVSVFNKG